MPWHWRAAVDRPQGLPGGGAGAKIWLGVARRSRWVLRGKSLGTPPRLPPEKIQGCWNVLAAYFTPVLLGEEF